MQKYIYARVPGGAIAQLEHPPTHAKLPKTSKVGTARSDKNFKIKAYHLVRT